MTTLLSQFLTEARDLLDEASRGLVALEREPESDEVTNRVFRAVHTLKGGAGFLAYESLTRLLHAAEDTLVALRARKLAPTPELIDLQLDCLDLVGTWLDSLAEREALPADASVEGERIAVRLRAQLLPTWSRPPRKAPPLTAPPRPAADLPDRLRAAAAQQDGPLLWVHYNPATQCFFAGEDPLLLVRTVPGLVAALIRGPAMGWEPLAGLDPYRCALRFELLASTSRAALEEHFQHVASEVTMGVVAPEPRSALAARGPAPSPAPAPGAASAPQRTVLKIDQLKIDRMMDLVGELIVATNAIPYLTRRAEQQGLGGLAKSLKDQHGVLHRIADELQAAVMQVRMLPLSFLFERYARTVRDLSRKLAKEVELVVDGEDTEADKSTVDRLGDALLHLLRNSIDHGIEPPVVRERQGKRRAGTLRLAGRREGDQLFITVSDDGRGMDPAALKQRARDKGLIDDARLRALSDQEALRLIFLPGFSTAEVVSDVSGRGVGMDVVRREIEALGGAVLVRSELGQGTSIELTLPLTMSITRVLTVEVGGETFGVPMDSVVAAVRVPRAELTRIRTDELFLFRDRLVPVRWLATLLGLPAPRAAAALAVLVTRVRGEEVGLVVDGFQEDMDIIVRPLAGVLAGYSAYLGTAILGNGRALLVLNLREVLSWRYSTDRTNTASPSAA